MTEATLYRIDKSKALPGDGGVDYCYQRMIDMGILVPVEPDLPYVAELVSELYNHARSEHTAFNAYQWAQRFIWRVQRGAGIGGDDEQI